MKTTTILSAVALVAGMALVAIGGASAAQAEAYTVSDLSAKQIANLRDLQKRFGPDHELIVIAMCESSLEHTTADGQVKRGAAVPEDTGLMQINKTYHQADARRMGFDLDRREDNIAYAEHLYMTQGRQPWSASFGCMARTSLPRV